MTTHDHVKRGATGYFAVLQWAYLQTDGSPTERYVLNMLAAASSDVGLTFPSVATLQKRTGLGESTIRAAIAHWKALGAITVTPRYISGTKKICANEYQLNPDRFPEEMVEDDTQVTPPGPGPLQVADLTPPGPGPLIGVTKDLPSSSLRSPRRSRREPEEAERGSWLLEDGSETEPGPPEKDWRPRKMTNAQYAVSLARRFARLSTEEGLIGGANVGGLTKFLRHALEKGGDREILSDLIDTFFDGQYFQKGRGAAPPWLQFTNQAYHLHQVLLDREKRKAPRERSKTYGAMPDALIKEIYGALPTE
jgi:hypothetical protein